MFSSRSVSEEKDIKTTDRVIRRAHKNNYIRDENRSSVDRNRTADFFTERKEAKKQTAIQSKRDSFESFREKIVSNSRNTIRRIRKALNSLITSIVSGGKDFEVTVDFEKSGPRKMFAAFAKLKKV